jgi:predicted nucleotidyltransferase
VNERAQRTSEIAEVVRREVEAEGARIVAAWLFGSFARGEATTRSDVDIAVLTARPRPFTLDELFLDLEERVGTALQRRAQVVIVDHAPADLVHRVLRDGLLLLDRDPARRIRFETGKRNEYFDLEPIRRICRNPR